MIFDRERAGSGPPEHLLGVGHKVVDRAIDQALQLDQCFAVVQSDKIQTPLLACRVFDRVTTGESIRSPIACGVELGGVTRIIQDWELLKKLNELSPFSLARMEPATGLDVSHLLDDRQGIIDRCLAFVAERESGFREPDVEMIAIMIPSTRVVT